MHLIMHYGLSYNTLQYSSEHTFRKYNALNRMTNNQIQMQQGI